MYRFSGCFREKKGHIVKIAYGRDEVLEKNLKYAIRIGTNFEYSRYSCNES